MEVGQPLYIQYEGHPDWHERRLLAKVGSGGTLWVILTPDGDAYAEDFAASNQEIVGVRLPSRGGRLPPGVPANDCYSFREVPTGDELKGALPDGEELAQAERLRYSDFPAAPTGEKWYACESGGTVKKGDQVTGPGSDPRSAGRHAGSPDRWVGRPLVRAEGSGGRCPGLQEEDRDGGVGGRRADLSHPACG